MLKGKFTFLNLLLGVLLLLGTLALPANKTALAISGGPLKNLGFEEVIPDSNPHPVPKYWGIDSAVDAVIVVDNETASEFPAYTDMNVTSVSPYRNNLMLRLGSPKTISEKQDDGDNTVSQEFRPTSDTLKLSLRIFSWENRGNDIVRIDLKPVGSSDASPVGSISFTDPDSSDGTVDLGIDPRLVQTARSGSEVLWEVNIELPKRGDYLDTGWIEAEISGIDPALYPNLVLSYTIGGTNNSSFSTWGYFDNVNTPPVARFHYEPSPTLEGGRLEFVDESYDLDEGDSIASWQWTLYGPLERGTYLTTNNSTRYLHDNRDNPWNSQNPVYIPADQGTYVVQLTVTDTEGASTTVSTGGTALDNTSIPELVVLSTPSKVKAMNVEVHEGDTITLFGRFLDHGFLDTHKASWEIPGVDSASIPTIVREDLTPFVDTGTVTGIVDWQVLEDAATASGISLPGTINTKLKVWEVSGGTEETVEDFQIKVLAAASDEHEANSNDIANAPDLPSNWVYSSYVNPQGDLDIFEIKRPDGTSLPGGSEVLVTLNGMQADYDLILLAQFPQGWDAADFDMSDFDMSDFDMSDFDMSDFDMSDFDMSDFDMSDFDMSDFDMSDFDMSDFDMSDFDMSDFDMSDFDMSDFDMSDFDMSPLSILSFTGLDGNDITATDIGLAELGLDGVLNEGTSVLGFSANRGLEAEALLGHVVVGGMKLYAIVVGSNGAFSNEPYSLQVESSIPKPIVATGESLVSEDQLTSVTEELYTQSGAPLTLFVTQSQRMEALYNADRWNTTLNDLIALADHPSVMGDIISVPSDIYVGWDTNPASIIEVNNVASVIKTTIQDYLDSHPSIEFVVMVGSDEVVPHRRVPDETKFNERFYALSSYLKWGSPLLFSMLGGYNLSDDYYVDKQPTAWQGRALYIPDTALGRLVETPEEISKAAITFINPAVNGVLNPETALVTGYDFFDNGAELTASFLDDALATTRAINSNWDRGFLLSEFLGEGGEAPDVAALNAHFTHYAALTEYGFTQGIGDILSSLDVAKATGDPTALFQRLVFSIGCHAGLNVPANSSKTVDPGLGLDPGLDFVQAMAQQQAIYVASTGFGIGDYPGIGGTERLLTIFADKLVHDNNAAGQALVDAKKSYLSSLSAMTVFDEKALIQTTFYGLPMYQLDFGDVAAGTVSTSSVDTVITSPSAAGTVSQSTSVVTVNQGTDYTRQEVSTDNGVYYTADGDAQTTAGRPIQPRVVIPLGEGVDNLVHGALLTDGTFADAPGSPNFDPVISRPTIEWETEADEPQIFLPSFWPSELAHVNSLQTEGGLLQTLVVIPGQFRADNFTGGIVTGTQYLYDNLTFELLISNSDDWQPAVVNSIELRPGEENSVVVTVDASDADSGIQSIVVLQIGNGTISSTYSGDLPGPAPYEVILSDYTDDNAIVIQVIDGAGNISVATGKGANIGLVDVDTVPQITAEENHPVTLQATLPDFANLTSPVFYIWDFGDGTVVSGITDDGTITVQHVYPDDNPTSTPSDQYQTKVKVTDSNGGIGTASTTITVLDVAPDVTIDLVKSPINENGTTDLSGSFTDISLLDTHSAKIDWGDGTPVEEPETFTQGAGSGSFTASHQYLDDDPEGTTSDNYTITVWVTDDDTVTGNTTASVVVNNLSPTVEAGADKTANEGDTVSFDPAQFNDTGTKDTHTATSDWGDGTTSDGNVTETNGSGTVSESSHIYADNGIYTVTVTVDDDDLGSGSDTLTVTVSNVAPTVGAIDAPTDVRVNNEMNATAAFIDPGILDTHTAVWDWGDGTSSTGTVSENNGSGTVADSHIYTTLGTFTVNLTVTDKDDGVGKSVFQSVNVHAWDPQGDSPSPDGDLISGLISNNSTAMTISLKVAGSITDQFQYRVYLHLGEEPPVLIKYDDGKLTGLPSLQAVVNGNELTFTFNLSDIAKSSSDSIEVSMETQAGIKATERAGKADYMPDAGTFGYGIR